MPAREGSTSARVARRQTGDSEAHVAQRGRPKTKTVQAGLILTLSKTKHVLIPVDSGRGNHPQTFISIRFLSIIQ